jgi:hypothetical protein
MADWNQLLSAIEYRQREPERQAANEMRMLQLQAMKDKVAKDREFKSFVSELNATTSPERTETVPDEAVNSSLADASSGLSKYGIQLDPSLQGQATTTKTIPAQYLSEPEKMVKMRNWFAMQGDFDNVKKIDEVIKGEQQRMGIHQILVNAVMKYGDKWKEGLAQEYPQYAGMLKDIEFNGLGFIHNGMFTDMKGTAHNLPNQSESKLVQGALTDKGYSVGYNSTTNQWTANVGGQNEPYSEAKHGKIQQAKQPIIVPGSNFVFQPGTLDYMAEIYESTGQVPSFGMGSAGMKARAEFFNKIADRAKLRGDTGAAQVARAAETKANTSALTDLTKREQLIESYNYRIKETSDKVLIPLIKKWDLRNPRFANLPVNKLAEVMGSGDLASLKLALNSVSVEVGKVEFNALGIQQLTDSATKFMKDIHDENMPVGELLKVIETSKQLGDTGKSAISQQRADLRKRMKGNVATPQKTEVQPTAQPKATHKYIPGQGIVEIK